MDDSLRKMHNFVPIKFYRTGYNLYKYEQEYACEIFNKIFFEVYIIEYNEANVSNIFQLRARWYETLHRLIQVM